MRRFIASILYAFADLLDPPAEPIQSQVWYPGESPLPRDTWLALKPGWDMPDPPRQGLNAYAQETHIGCWSCWWGDDWGRYIQAIENPFPDNTLIDEEDYRAVGFKIYRVMK